ncbi:hypothetical protein OG21DRAFT_1526346 [Imleria badia]|nr:hypothetical protein OG21DRAFT_1526346 [Imleria badia]
MFNLDFLTPLCPSFALIVFCSVWYSLLYFSIFCVCCLSSLDRTISFELQIGTTGYTFQITRPPPPPKEPQLLLRANSNPDYVYDPLLPHLVQLYLHICSSYATTASTGSSHPAAQQLATFHLSEVCIVVLQILHLAGFAKVVQNLPLQLVCTHLTNIIKALTPKDQEAYFEQDPEVLQDFYQDHPRCSPPRIPFPTNVPNHPPSPIQAHSGWDNSDSDDEILVIPSRPTPSQNPQEILPAKERPDSPSPQKFPLTILSMATAVLGVGLADVESSSGGVVTPPPSSTSVSPDTPEIVIHHAATLSVPAHTVDLTRSGSPPPSHVPNQRLLTKPPPDNISLSGSLLLLGSTGCRYCFQWAPDHNVWDCPSQPPFCSACWEHHPTGACPLKADKERLLAIPDAPDEDIAWDWEKHWEDRMKDYHAHFGSGETYFHMSA